MREREFDVAVTVCTDVAGPAATLVSMRARSLLIAGSLLLAACSSRPIASDGGTGAGAFPGSSGAAGRGVARGTGGAVSTGGASGDGGAVSTGGSGTAGDMGAGGAAGASGAAGTGGAPTCSAACVAAGTLCLSAASLQTCTAAGDACFTATTETCATSLVCERYAPAACADPQWVAWPMPNGKEDVAAGAPNEMSFTDNGDGTVTDNVTRLMWQRAVPAEKRLFAAAVTACDDLVLAGHDDWRLPSMVELISIADLGRSDPAIDVTAFPSTPADNFWSSTTFATSPTTVATVTFARGNTQQKSKTEVPYYVRCVR